MCMEYTKMCINMNIGVDILYTGEYNEPITYDRAISRMIQKVKL